MAWMKNINSGFAIVGKGEEDERGVRGVHFGERRLGFGRRLKEVR